MVSIFLYARSAALRQQIEGFLTRPRNVTRPKTRAPNALGISPNSLLQRVLEPRTLAR